MEGLLQDLVWYVFSLSEQDYDVLSPQVIFSHFEKHYSERLVFALLLFGPIGGWKDASSIGGSIWNRREGWSGRHTTLHSSTT